jgi:hypothetical protein
MQAPLRYQVHEFLKTEKNATDDEILDMLNKSGPCSINELNKVLLQLEILGLVDVRWIGKDKRRVELVEATKPESPSSERED